VIQFSSVQLLSRVRLFATPWTTARQASLSITNSLSASKPMSIESVMPSNHLILCRPLLLLPSIFPASVFSIGQLFASGGQRIGVAALASFLPKKSQVKSLVNLEQLLQAVFRPKSWIVMACLWFLPTIVYCASHIWMPKNPLKTSLKRWCLSPNPEGLLP